MAAAGTALLVLVAAACTPGGSTATGAPFRSAPTAAQARHDIVLSTRPGNPDAAILGTVTAPSLLARKAMSCPGEGQSAGQLALLDATWRYRDGITYLSRLSIGFDLKTAVVNPFVTVTLDSRGGGPRGRLGLWASAPLWGNNVSGQHTTGWTAAGPQGGPLATRQADPRLMVQVWAEDSVTARIYCVSATGFNLGTH
jgi:hypothetical protein